jgi:hypothetical protein
MSTAPANRGTPARSSVDLNTVTTVVFVVTILAMALLSIQLKVLDVQQGTGGSGQGHGGEGNGTGTGKGVGAGEATTPTNGGYGDSGASESADKLGYGPGGGGSSGMVQPEKPADIKQQNATSTPEDLGFGAAGKAQGRDIDMKKKPTHVGGVQLGNNSSSGGGGGGGQGPDVPQIKLPDKVKWLLLVITVLAIGTAVAYLVRSYLKARREALRKAAKPRGKGKRKRTIPDAVASDVTDEFIATIEMTYDTLAKMGDVRKAITLCYSRMCGVIADKGMVRNPDVTPREFYTVVKKAFDVDSGSMKGLTVLFEEAVYSEHPMTDVHRDSALRLLKEAVTEVKSW